MCDIIQSSACNVNVMFVCVCGAAPGTAPGVPHPAAEHLWGRGGARLGGG